MPEVGANLAEPVQRLVGDFIDYVIIAVPYFIISLILFSVFTTTETVFGVEVETGRSYVGYLLTSLVGAAIAFGYAFVLLKGQGTTIGKKVMGMRVARADGQPLDQQTILIRSGVFAAPYFLSYLIPVLGWLLSLVITVGSLILIFTDKRRESVLDKAAKTVVVSTK